MKFGFKVFYNFRDREAYPRVLNTLAYGLLFLGLAKCADHHADGPLSSSETHAVRQVNEYERREKHTNLGSIVHYQMNAEHETQKRVALEAYELRELPINGAYGTRVFQVRSSGESLGLFVKPKVLIRTSLLGERASVVETEDQKIQVHLSLALVNGLISEIPTGRGLQRISQEFLIPNSEGLLRDLGDILRSEPQFISQVKCPEVIQIRISRETSFDVRLESQMKSCPFNVFFPASFTLSTEEWAVMQRSFLREGTVQLDSEMLLSVPLTRQYADFRIHRSFIKEYLQNHFASVSEAELRPSHLATALSGLVARIQQDLETDFDPSYFSSFQEDLISSYFSRLEPSHCPSGSHICFHLRVRERDDRRTSPDVNISIKQQDYVGRTVFLRTHSSLVDDHEDRQQVLIRASRESPLRSPEVASLGEVSRIFRTVDEGELLELSISALSYGTVELEVPSTEVRSERVCRRPYSLCRSGRFKLRYDMPHYRANLGSITCARHQQGPAGRSTPERNTCVCIPEQWEPCGKYPIRFENEQELDYPALQVHDLFANHIDHWNEFVQFECLDRLDNQCKDHDWEDRVTRTTRWSVPSFQPRFVDKSVEPQDIQAILAGLSIQFRFPGSQVTQICPLSSFEPELLPNSRILFSVKNNPQCQPFQHENRDQEQSAAIDFINRSWFESHYTCGNRVEDWQGDRTYRCQPAVGGEIVLNTTVAQEEESRRRGESIGIRQPYYPRLQIQGSIRSVGRVFVNEREE